ncbi:hypothetical protein TH63_18310 [Rufibacter radiotolerans]|uniref:Lipocalin-like domain-containing protein n=1 Tax=Rufibacter radiotolerans TaxID=1379910 RepID=A0A0H4VT99_9BACT|nr:lipocalin family protein [Rufibacter radiotolerans]AKQ47152.1 hypothetical protein TH63_18310 [Rufibacter radiotolerans]
MKKHYLLLTILAIFSLSFTACNDDDEDEKPDDKKLLTGKSWKITAFTAAQGPASYDIYSDMEPCDQDDLWKFSDNGSYEINEGPSKCDPNSAQVYESGTYTLDNKTLITTESGSSNTYKVVEITATTLKLTTEQAISGTNTTFNLTFAGQ